MISANLTFDVAFAEMITRRLEPVIADTLQRSPSVALMGPRQVGKTTIALDISGSISSVYLDLENRLDLQKVRDVNTFHAGNTGTVLDDAGA